MRLAFQAGHLTVFGAARALGLYHLVCVRRLSVIYERYTS